MASANRGHRGIVTSCEGMEVDLSAAGIHELPESQGIEASPRELHLRPVQGLEATPEELSLTSAPQTVNIPEKELAHGRAMTAQLRPASSSDLKIPSGSRLSRKLKRFLPLLVAAIIIAVVIVALAIPLALQLKKPTRSSSPVNLNSTTRVPTILPTFGAFNETGLALIALDLTDVPDVNLFYQDNNSQIRRLHSIELSPFVGGFPIVASNARNTTPLTTLTYPTSTGDLNSHLYYIDINDTLQELYSPDNLTTWELGSLGDYNFTVSNSSTALTAFYSDHWLGQDGDSPGIRLYYGAPDNKVHELALFPNVSSQYFSHSVLSGTNGNAGIASGWLDGTGLGNLYLFDENNQFQIWSNNFNITHGAAQNASYGSWVEDPSQTYYSIKENTALGFGGPPAGGILCFQQTSNEITCSSMSSSDGSLLPPSDAHSPPAVTGLQSLRQGSALVAAWQATPGTFPYELNIFYQTENGDIIQNIDATGTWVNSTLPVR